MTHILVDSLVHTEKLLHLKLDSRSQPPFQHPGITFTSEVEWCDTLIIGAHTLISGPPFLKIGSTTLVCHSIGNVPDFHTALRRFPEPSQCESRPHLVLCHWGASYLLYTSKTFARDITEDSTESSDFHFSTEDSLVSSGAAFRLWVACRLDRTSLRKIERPSLLWLFVLVTTETAVLMAYQYFCAALRPRDQTSLNGLLDQLDGLLHCGPPAGAQVVATTGTDDLLINSEQQNLATSHPEETLLLNKHQ